MTVRSISGVGLIFLTSMQIFGQSMISAPMFDVASVKPSDPAGSGSGIFSSPGEFTAKKRTLKDVIAFAYDVRDFQLAGGSSWLDSDAFDIVAKPGGQQVRLMVQALLADRFRLAIHRETRTLPVYALVVAKNGPRLQKAKDDETLAIRSGVFQKVDIPLLVRYLSAQVDHIVLDKTGLTGSYDFTLKWASNQGPPSGPGDGQGRGTAPDNPPIFTAIQEQLGLKLEPTKGPVEIIVIDHAEKPGAN